MLNSELSLGGCCFWVSETHCAAHECVKGTALLAVFPVLWKRGPQSFLSSKLIILKKKTVLVFTLKQKKSLNIFGQKLQIVNLWFFWYFLNTFKHHWPIHLDPSWIRFDSYPPKNNTFCCNRFQGSGKWAERTYLCINHNCWIHI